MTQRTYDNRGEGRVGGRGRRTLRRRGAVGGPGGGRGGVVVRIVCVFLEVLNQVKLYHWRTRKYSEHKATDELYERLGGHIDRFVEVLLGKDGSRMPLKHTLTVYDGVDSVGALRRKLGDFVRFLGELDRMLDAAGRDSDLISIRDDILSDVNQFLYLLSLS
jgi:hypothetical protein